MGDTPRLDQRRFQDLVDDAQRFLDGRIPGADPIGEDAARGILEAAALMVDELLVRLDQVPDRVHGALLDLVGVQPHPARAARTELTFWRATPAEEDTVVPSGTSVGVPSGPEFSTLRPLRLVAVRELNYQVVRGGEEPLALDDLAYLHAYNSSFNNPPLPGDALMVALSAPAPSCALSLTMTSSVPGVGVDPRNPPLVWEASTRDGWRRCHVEADETGGLCVSGRVLIHLPHNHDRMTVGSVDAVWVRCRIVEAEPGVPGYTQAPLVEEISAATVGGTVAAIQGELVAEELVGVSDGRPGQCLRMRAPTAIDPDENVVVEVFEHDSWVPWSIVSGFADSGPTDRVVQVVPGRAEVRFGPSLKEPDGMQRSYGATPPDGAPVRIRNHLVGGGRLGNVAEGTIRVLHTTLPHIARVENRVRATGGHDAESTDEARRRVPLELRGRGRAVTLDDFEYLAREAAPEVARVHCLPDEAPGSVRVLVVPWMTEAGYGFNFADLVPANDTLQRIASYLDERRVIGTRVLVEPPRYCGVTIVTKVRAAALANKEKVLDSVRRQLHTYYHPTTGGPDGDGWPFGRPVVMSEAFSVVQRVPGVDLVEDLLLFPADPITGERGDSTQRISVGDDSLVFSFDHHVQVVTA